MPDKRRRNEIVTVRCLTCGVEVSGVVRDGMLYATNAGRPDGTRTIEGYCAAHGNLYVPMTAR